MSPVVFKQLLVYVGPGIIKQEAAVRDPVSARERLVLTFRFLTTGDAQRTLARPYRMNSGMVSHIISETSSTMRGNLADYIKSIESIKY